MAFFRFIAAVLVALLPVAGSAATVSYSASLASQPGKSASLSLDRFDTKLGSLTQVDVSLSGTYEFDIFTEFTCADVRGCNPSRYPFLQLEIATIASISGKTTSITPPNHPEYIFCKADFGELCRLAGHPSLTFSLTKTISEAASLAEFVGTAPFDVTFAALTAGMYTPLNETLSDLSARVTYTYEPAAVPLPAGLPLLAGAFGGLGLIRRSRRT